MNKRSQQNENRGPINRFEETNNGQQAEIASQAQWAEKAKQLSSSLVGKVETTIQARPLTCLGIAAGIGVLAAFWSKRK